MTGVSEGCWEDVLGSRQTDLRRLLQGAIRFQSSRDTTTTPPPREVETLLGLESTLLAAAMAEPGSLPLESRMRQAPTTDRLVP